MKTTVSLPYNLFRQAEATSQRLGLSRSELYAKAIAAFIKQQDEIDIRQRLDDLHTRIPAKLDPLLHAAQLRSVEPYD